MIYSFLLVLFIIVSSYLLLYIIFYIEIKYNIIYNTMKLNKDNKSNFLKKKRVLGLSPIKYMLTIGFPLNPFFK